MSPSNTSPSARSAAPAATTLVARTIEASGEPHLACGHPTAGSADLSAQFTEFVVIVASTTCGCCASGHAYRPGGAHGDAGGEIWPVISYGNAVNASVLNRMLDSRQATASFIKDAIKVVHAQNLTGLNFDLETQGTYSKAHSLATAPQTVGKYGMIANGRLSFGLGAGA